MSNLLQQLENNEGILLMYQAGELPQADRLEVEQMLAADPALRSELAEIASMHDLMTAALSQGNESLVPSRRDAAVRQVSQAIAAADLGAHRTRRVSARSSHSGLRIAPWAYPIAAAAALVIGLIIFSGNRPGPSQFVRSTPIDPIPTFPPVTQGPVEIIPVVATDDSLSQIKNDLLSLRSSSGDLDLFGDGPPEIEH